MKEGPGMTAGWDKVKDAREGLRVTGVIAVHQ